MSESKTRQAWYDRRLRTTGEAYELGYFAEKHGIPTAEARVILQRCGDDRNRANQEARRLRAQPAPRRSHA
jgi:hypothetical protein